MVNGHRELVYKMTHWSTHTQTLGVGSHYLQRLPRIGVQDHMLFNVYPEYGYRITLLSMYTGPIIWL